MPVQIIKENEYLGRDTVNYANAATISSKRVDRPFKEIQSYYGMLRENGGDIHIKTPEPSKNITFIYKVFCPVSKKTIFRNTNKIEKCLTLVLGEVTYFARGNKFATVELRFSFKGRSLKLSHRTLKTGEMVLLPSCMEQ